MHRSVAHSTNDRSDHSNKNHGRKNHHGPILNAIGQAIKSSQERKHAEQYQHDELIRKTQELKDRERNINRRETEKAINNIFDSITEVNAVQQQRIAQAESQRLREELARKDLELRQQQELNKKTAWEQQRTVFVNKFNSIESCMNMLCHCQKSWSSNRFGENLELVSLDIDRVILIYDQNAYQANIEEQQMRKTLTKFRNTIDSKQKWQNIRIETNTNMRTILDNESVAAAEGQIVGSNEIKQNIKSLNACLKTYNQYHDFLNDAEKDYLIKIPNLIDRAQQQLLNNRIQVQRQLERTRDNNCEQDINQNLEIAKKQFFQGKLTSALESLQKAHEKSRDITNWNNVSIELNNKINYLSSSIQILQTEVSSFNQRRDQNSLGLSTKIINEALLRSNYTDKTLLERHYIRLQSSISDDLKRNWCKFDKNQDQNIDDLFNQISQCITAELIPSGFLKRWAPLNWTNASLHLERSKFIAPEISMMIDTWVPNPQLFTLNIPIFQVNNEVIPTAEIVETPFAGPKASAPLF